MQTLLTPAIREAADALIGNLLASESFVGYHEAQSRLNENHEARDLLDQLSKAQTSVRKKQANGRVTQAEVDSLRAIQAQVERNTVIMTYAQTQQKAIKLLREINGEISQLLGINFASFANHATC